MKKLFLLYSLFFILTFCQKTFSQEKYNFDYYTIYEYKLNKKDSISDKIFTFSNSINSDYHLEIVIKKNNNVSYVSLFDFKNRLHYVFPNFTIDDINKGDFLKNSTYSKLNFDPFINNHYRYYDIAYHQNNDVQIIDIKQYKNTRKKKLVNECILETKTTEVTKLQHFNFYLLRIPLWCQKFILNNTGVITKASFIENDKKTYTINLIEIKKTELTLNVTTKNNIAN